MEEGDKSDHDHGNTYQQRHRQQSKPRNLLKHWKLLLLFVLLIVAIVVLAVDLALKPEPADIDHNWLFLDNLTLATTDSSSPTTRDPSQSSNSSNSSSSRMVGAVIRSVLALSNPNLSGRFVYYDAACSVFVLPGRIAAGSAAIPAGTIQAQGTKNLSATVHADMIHAGRELGPNSTLVITSMTGFVSKWIVFKHHFKLSSLCELHISAANAAVESYSCGIGT